MICASDAWLALTLLLTTVMPVLSCDMPSFNSWIVRLRCLISSCASVICESKVATAFCKVACCDCSSASFAWFCAICAWTWASCACRAARWSAVASAWTRGIAKVPTAVTHRTNATKITACNRRIYQESIAAIVVTKKKNRHGADYLLVSQTLYSYFSSAAGASAATSVAGTASVTISSGTSSWNAITEATISSGFVMRVALDGSLMSEATI